MLCCRKRRAKRQLEGSPSSFPLWSHARSARAKDPVLHLSQPPPVPSLRSPICRANHVGFLLRDSSVPVKANAHIITAAQQPAAPWVEVSVAGLHSSASWEHYTLSRVSGLTSSIPLPWFPLEVPRLYDFRAIGFSRSARDSAAPSRNSFSTLLCFALCKQDFNAIHLQA